MSQIDIAGGERTEYLMSLGDHAGKLMGLLYNRDLDPYNRLEALNKIRELTEDTIRELDNDEFFHFTEGDTPFGLTSGEKGLMRIAMLFGVTMLTSLTEEIINAELE